MNRRSVSNWVYGHVLYPTALRAAGEGILPTSLASFKEDQWIAPEVLARKQEERLAEILRYAVHRTARYGSYRVLLDEISATPIGALQSFPFLTKAQLQSERAALLAHPAPRRVTEKTTGGSTGQAVTVVKDRDATAHERAAMWLGYGWFGVEMGDRVARFWGAPFAFRNKWVVRLSDALMHRIRFSAFAFSDADLERYYHRCLSFRPDYLHGYVSMLEAFARFLDQRGLDLAGRVSLKSIVATSEVLTEPQRALMERVFGAPVQAEYGCGEVGPIAYQCERGSLHLMTVNLFVEVLRADGSPAGTGETGEIVVTDLTNRAMPIIRYRIGDNGVPGEECACGRGLPVLATIWGRAYDFVVAPDGRRFHGEFFMYLFEDLRREGWPIGQFKVIQHSAQDLEFLFVAPSLPKGDIRKRIQRFVAERAPGFNAATVTHVQEIRRSASGKMQVIENRYVGSKTEAGEQLVG